MSAGSLVLFDTSVYVAAIRGGDISTAHSLIQEHLPRTYLASVVCAELRAGATTERARRAVHDFTWRMEKVGRMVAPSVGAWQRAGDVLGLVHRNDPRLRSKIPRLWNDVLIALCARQVGATVITHNPRDFDLIRRYIRFDLRTLSWPNPQAAHSPS